MGNAIFSWSNYVEAATTALSSNSEATTMGVTQLADSHLVTRWRSSNVLTSVYIRADLGSALPIETVGLFGTNLSASATWRIKLGTTAGGTEVYDSGTVSALPLGASQPKQAIGVLSQVYTARHVEVLLNDSGNANGFIEAGILWIGDGWRPDINISYGWSQGYADESQTSRSRGGQTFVDVRSKYRFQEFALEFMTEAQVHTVMFDIDRTAGVGKNIFFVPAPEGAYLQAQALLGRMSDLGAVTNPYYNVYGRRFRIEERL